METKKAIRVVGAAIIDGDRLLVAQRPYSDKTYKAYKWEFPGGKIESGETESDAIIREIHEELGCTVVVDDLLSEIEHEYPDFILWMTMCICHLESQSIPMCLEHNSIKWITPDRFQELDWAAADERCCDKILEWLNRNR